MKNAFSAAVPGITTARACPPAGQSRDYAFVVSAMGKDNLQPLAVRLYRFTQE